MPVVFEQGAEPCCVTLHQSQHTTREDEMRVLPQLDGTVSGLSRHCVAETRTRGGKGRYIDETVLPASRGTDATSGTATDRKCLKGRRLKSGTTS